MFVRALESTIGRCIGRPESLSELHMETLPQILKTVANIWNHLVN